MANRKVLMVQNDTAPNIRFNCVDDDDAIIDVSGATVRFKIKNPTTGLITNTAHVTCTIIDAPNGVVEYPFQTGDIPDAGTYQCDLEITYASGKIQTAYNIQEITVRAENG